MSLTYDAGALIAAAKGERRVWSIHQRALMRGDRPVVPAGVLVEVYESGEPALERFLRGCHIDPLTEVLARATGTMLRESAVDADAVDACVVEGALRRRDAVVTSNAGDLTALADGVGRKLAVIPV